MTAVLSGEADIGFMGSESSIYTYQEGANDVIINFAQLTQRAGNFLVAREEMPDFSWDDLKGKDILGGRKGGMTIPSNLNRALLPLKLKMPVMSLLLSALIPAISRTPHTVPKQVI